MKALLGAKFISEVKYMERISNVVLAKKASGKWRMHVGYTDLNRACSKDSYLLSDINMLIDNSSGYKLILFMDAYYGYNHIPMFGPNMTRQHP